MLRLRPFKPGDAALVLSWIKSEYAFRQWSADRYDHYPITPGEMNAHYDALVDSGWFYPMTAFDENGVAGHLILRFTDEVKKSLRFGFVIVDDSRRGQGLGKELLALALKEAFGPLKAEKVTLGVFDNNPAAYHCYRAAGFRDVTSEEPEYYRVLGEDWKCLELEMTAAEYEKTSAAPASLPALFLTFAKIGLFTFGGGYAMIALIENACVEQKRWITHDEMMTVTVIAESTPGPIAINCATYVGYRQRGFLGALIATLGMVMPSFCIIFAIASFLDRFLEITWIARAFRGIKIAVGILILDAALKMIRKMKPKPFPRAILICACAAMLIIDFTAVTLSSIYLMAAAGAVSLAVFLARRPAQKGGGAK